MTAKLNSASSDAASQRRAKAQADGPGWVRDLKPLPRPFFARDPLDVAPDLLGRLLVHMHDDRGPVVGRIVEVEAYRGEEDKACHARAGLTKRTRLMYGPPGYAYIYLIYGMYDLLNVVTWPAGQPSAVLVRAVEPILGISRTSNGPGRLTMAMGITRALNGTDLLGDRLFLADDAPGRMTLGASPLGTQTASEISIETSTRIRVDYAGDWAHRPWRFSIRGSSHVSKGR